MVLSNFKTLLHNSFALGYPSDGGIFPKNVPAPLTKANPK